MCTLAQPTHKNKCLTRVMLINSSQLQANLNLHFSFQETTNEKETMLSKEQLAAALQATIITH